MGCRTQVCGKQCDSEKSSLGGRWPLTMALIHFPKSLLVFITWPFQGVLSLGRTEGAWECDVLWGQLLSLVTLLNVFFFFFNHFHSCSLFKKIIYLIYLFLAVLGLCCYVRAFFSFSKWAATLCCSVQSSHCGGFSCCRAWALGTRASVVVAHGLSCSEACGIFPDQGSNPCPLHWQVDS